ncbi:glycolate oxidase subunit GlcF [Undibacterium sp.]|uniref:glycolate oxidase subunit GlcF n=1 Tax=Undibacterium sp. TaxID=1914977 RepID=UPI0037536A04
MQTKISENFSHTNEGQEAEQILRQCVHCGMCNATCPTYQLLGDELDGPRGRIYLIKQVLEGQQATQKTQTHLDRCLTCRSCETTCPSGVDYARLLEIGRDIVEKQVGRSWSQKLLRSALKNGLSNPRLFQHALQWGRRLKPILPQQLQEKIPPASVLCQAPSNQYNRKVILLEGCVQGSLAPNINAATKRVLDRLQIQAIVASQAACCGAVRLHLSDEAGAKLAARQNIDAWWPIIQQSSETEQSDLAIVMTASGCGVTVKDYAILLAHDQAYAEKAKRISALTVDLSEYLESLTTELITLIGGEISQRLAWHSPCSLQHGQQVRGKVETILRSLGVDVRSCENSHLCCGSAGTYSILQPELAKQLRDNKILALERTQADVIVSANMACQQHLQTGTKIPVKHWIEVIDLAMSNLPGEVYAQDRKKLAVEEIDAVVTQVETVAPPTINSIPAIEIAKTNEVVADATHKANPAKKKQTKKKSANTGKSKKAKTQ